MLRREEAQTYSGKTGFMPNQADGKRAYYLPNIALEERHLRLTWTAIA
jgi:hypothetical protein